MVEVKLSPSMQVTGIEPGWHSASMYEIHLDGSFIHAFITKGVAYEVANRLQMALIPYMSKEEVMKLQR